ncbi:MAG: YhbY family RNA-binding protein [Spirochaetia bacterium]|jgi:RNA-binding protein|nr:YhbY family RNA-binding protein [Spirochaetia bacterium]
MKELTSKDRYNLSRISNTLKPVIWVGKNGMTEQVLTAVDELLDKKELIKIKFVNLKDEKKEISEEISGRTKSFLVRIIGNNAIFYRMASDPKNRSIALDQ